MAITRPQNLLQGCNLFKAVQAPLAPCQRGTWCWQCASFAAFSAAQSNMVPLLWPYMRATPRSGRLHIRLAGSSQMLRWSGVLPIHLACLLLQTFLGRSWTGF